jgi:hypothetical protein
VLLLTERVLRVTPAAPERSTVRKGQATAHDALERVLNKLESFRRALGGARGNGLVHVELG